MLRLPSLRDDDFTASAERKSKQTDDGQTDTQAEVHAKTRQMSR